MYAHCSMLNTFVNYTLFGSHLLTWHHPHTNLDHRRHQVESIRHWSLVKCTFKLIGLALSDWNHPAVLLLTVALLVHIVTLLVHIVVL